MPSLDTIERLLIQVNLNFVRNALKLTFHED
jgi:hypothetical protein